MAGGMARRRVNAELWNWRCEGTSRSTGERCKRPCAPGAKVCNQHGGLVPAVIELAEERMRYVWHAFAVEVSPALATVLEIMGDRMARNIDRLKAAQVVLQYGLSAQALKAVLGSQDDRRDGSLDDEVEQLLEAFTDDRDPGVLAREIVRELEALGVEVTDDEDDGDYDEAETPLDELADVIDVDVKEAL